MAQQDRTAARSGRQTERAREADFDLVHARVLRFFPELVRELGGDADALLRRSGIESQGDTAQASYRQTVALLELAAAELDCPDFGMRLATRQNDGVFGPLGVVMKNSATFGDALAYATGHSYAHSLAARVWLKRLPGGGVFAGHDILLDHMPHRSQAMEQLLLLGHLAAGEMTHGRARVRRVHFRHQAVSALKVYRRYFGCEVRFGQNEDGVVFHERDLASPVVDPDARVYRRAAAFIEARFTQHLPPLHAQVRGRVMQLLGSERCTNEHIAAELQLHLRTLHRRLRDEGTSFQRIKDAVRRDMLLYYAEQTDLDFAYVSERLGFAEQSVLTRNSRRWFAAAPTTVRARSRRAG